jgi:hypothetical protein
MAGRLAEMAKKENLTVIAQLFNMAEREAELEMREKPSRKKSSRNKPVAN